MSPRTRSMAAVMVCAAAAGAQFVGAKATRDALYLTSLDVTTLPTMLLATSICSILLVIGYARLSRSVPPAILVPASFFVSGLLFLGEWLIRASAPATAAVLMYLHVSGAGPLLLSGFWLITSERFDPRTAKQSFGPIAGAGTLGGLAGALVAERVAALAGVPAMLLVLAGFQFATAWLVWLVAKNDGAAVGTDLRTPDDVAVPSRSALRIVAEAPHLRHLAALVLVGTTAAALLEYLFKASAVEAFGPGDTLLRFFAVYYAVTSLIAFVLQTLSSRAVLERFGLGLTTSTPSIALVAGSLGSLLVPGFAGLAVARAGESIFRGSWFRTGYELFYTPLAATERRAAKSVIDVAIERLGDAVGGGLVRIVIVFLPVAPAATILWLAVAISLGAVVLASTLNRWYLRTLESSLVRRGSGIDLSDPTAATRLASWSARAPASRASLRSVESAARTVSIDPEIEELLSLRSRDRERVIRVLSKRDGLSASLVPDAVRLLAWDPVADHARRALRKVADERVGELADALLDARQVLTVRRRLARVFSVCRSPRAAEALVAALDDPRFAVRFQAARSLAAVLRRNPDIEVPRERIFQVVLRETAVSRPVWEGRRLLDESDSDATVDEFVRHRASQSLTHVFTLLSLVLPREPLLIAFRSFQSHDAHMRGTALEYLEGVLPPPIRARLWPFIGQPQNAPSAQEHTQALEGLLRASESITLQNAASRMRGRAVVRPASRTPMTPLAIGAQF